MHGQTDDIGYAMKSNTYSDVESVGGTGSVRRTIIQNQWEEDGAYFTMKVGWEEEFDFSVER